MRFPLAPRITPIPEAVRIADANLEQARLDYEAAGVALADAFDVLQVAQREREAAR